MISSVVAALALAASTQSPNDRAQSPPTAPVAQSDVAKAAQEWLALVDAGKWRESWAATAPSFQSLNTVEVWQSVSESARVPLGRVVSRTFGSEESIPAPPRGYRLVRFRTQFANKPAATETLSLSREGESWKVAGYIID